MESSYLFQTIKDENDNPLYFTFKTRNLLPNREIGIYVNSSLVFKFTSDPDGNITETNIAIPEVFLVDFLTLGGFGQTVDSSDMLPTTGTIGLGGAGDISLELRYV